MKSAQFLVPVCGYVKWHVVSIDGYTCFDLIIPTVGSGIDNKHESWAICIVWMSSVAYLLSILVKYSKDFQ